MPRLLPALLAPVAALAVALPPGPAAPDDGGRPLFNGKDLTGWVNVNCAPGTFFAKDNEIVTTGRPTGFLRTDRQYENFELEMEWLHENKTAVGNSGLFVWGDPLPAVGTGYTRGIEVQVLVNYKADWATSHGDLFSIWGAKCTPDRPHPKGIERCLPSEERCKGGGEWNHYKVVANDGSIKLHVNGKEVSGVSKCSPRKGYLALESEGAVCHFRNLRIKELPSTNPKPEETAKLDEGHVSLFTGLDLSGWKTADGAWKADGGVLRAAGTGTSDLVSEKKYGPVEIVFDWKQPQNKDVKDARVQVSVPGAVVSLYPDGKQWSVYEPRGPANSAAISLVERYKPGTWNRAKITVDRKTAKVRVNDIRLAILERTTPIVESPITIKPSSGLEIRSLFARELKED